MRRTSLLRFAIFTIGVMLNVGRADAQTKLAPGDHEFTMRHGGRARTYLVHVPARTKDRPAVIIAFHGGGGNAKGFQEYAELDAIADREGFLVVYPNGTGRGVPVLQIHSVDDPRALYVGGLGPPFPGTNNRVFHQPVQAGLDRWIAANKCRTRPDTVETRRDANVTATHLVWRGCADGAEVAHWKLTGSGHAWPADAEPPGGERLAGPQTTIVRAAEEVWKFVSRFSR